MQRLRALCTLVLLLVAEVGALLFLGAARSVPRWQVDWSSWAALSRWMDVNPGADVAVGLLIWTGLAVGSWLVVSTVLYVLASLTRSARLMRVTGVFTLPGVRRVVERGLATSLAVSALFPTAAALAQPPGGGWAPPVVSTAGPTLAVAGVAPPAALGTVPPAVAPTDTAWGSWPVSRDDNLWHVTAEVIAHVTSRDVGEVTDDEIHPYWQEVKDAVLPGLQSGDADLIYAGETLDLPPYPGAVVRTAAAVVLAPEPAPAPTPVAVPAPSPEPSAATTAPPATAAPTTAVTVEPAAVEAAPADDAPALAPAPVRAESAAVSVAPEETPAASGQGLNAGPWLLGGVAAAGLVLELGRRRRKANRDRQPGEELPEAEPELQEVEHKIRLVADVDGLRFVDAALRALGSVVGVNQVPPVGLVLGGTDLTVVLAEPREGEELPDVAPAPFTGRGSRWTIARSHPIDELMAIAEDTTMPVPALVTLGQSADGDQILVDLEDSCVLAIEGPGAAEVVTAAAVQLATAQWSQIVDVLLVGFASPPTGPTVRAVDTLEEDELDRIQRQAVRAAGMLAEAGCESTFQARVTDRAEETWVPTVVVCASPPPERLARRLVSLSEPEAHGVAVLVAGHVPGAPWTLAINQDRIVVPGLGTVVVPQKATAAQAEGMREVLTAASRAPVPAPPPPAGLVPDEDQSQVVVSLYGPVGVEGHGDAFRSRGKSLEMFAYVACHKAAGTVDGDRLRGVLWPEGCESRTLFDTKYFLRQVVGDHMPALSGAERIYGVGPLVVTSVQLLDAALDASRRLPSDEAVANLRSALEWVRGLPFDAPTRSGRGGGKPQTAYEWAHSEGHIRDAARIAVDAAHRLHELALEAGDIDMAAWATAQGRKAAPDDPQFDRDDMMTEGARGDLDRLDGIFRGVRREVEGGEGGATVDPLTLAVYEKEREALVS